MNNISIMKVKTLWDNRRWLRSIFYTILFNFRYLPFRQAIKLPILLYKPRISGSGKYIIEGTVVTGMIQLGYQYVSLFDGRGIKIENNGTIIFKGRTKIGHNSFISVGKTGKLMIGNKAVVSTGLKIACYHHVSIGNEVLIGWNVFITDTDFHVLRNVDGEILKNPCGSVYIGDKTWVSSFCKFYKNSSVPSECTIASNSIINKRISTPPLSLIFSENKISFIHTKTRRYYDRDTIDYDVLSASIQD